MTKIAIKATLRDRLRAEPDRIGRNLTAGQIEAWIDNQVTDLASAKDVLKRLAVEVARLNHLLGLR